jgi:hypothetical protein
MMNGTKGMNRVLHKIKQMWPDADPQEILDLLNAYGTESYETGRTRVQLAILKLSEGDRERLPDLVKMAKVDFRDVLPYAEYPQEMRTDPIKMRDMPEEEAQSIRQRDRKQYESWLKK